MGSAAVLDKFWSPYQPADAPASSVEILAGGADGDSEIFDLLGESCDARERSVVESVVDLFHQYRNQYQRPNTQIKQGEDGKVTRELE